MNVATISETNQYLTFTLAEEVFALDVGRVREVLDYSPVTKIPRTPKFMKGVINVRGSVVPVVDMRLKFGMETAEQTVDTCIVLMELTMDGETTVVGAVADSVKEVIDQEANQIEPAPRLGTRFNSEFINGIGKRDDQFIIILDIDKVFSSDELVVLDSACEKSASTNEN